MLVIYVVLGSGNVTACGFCGKANVVISVKFESGKVNGSYGFCGLLTSFPVTLMLLHSS